MEWERQPREPMLWYSRFEQFRLLGPRRSMLALYRKSKPEAKTVPAAFRQAAEKWNWRERAEKWDIHLLEEQRLQEAEDRLAERKARKALLRRFREKLEKAVTKYAPKRPFDVAIALRILLEQSRKEHDDEPKNRHEISGPNGSPVPVEIVWKTTVDDSGRVDTVLEKGDPEQVLGPPNNRARR